MAGLEAYAMAISCIAQASPAVSVAQLKHVPVFYQCLLVKTSVSLCVFVPLWLKKGHHKGTKNFAENVVQQPPPACASLEI